MEAKVYNQKGKETGSITLPESVFGLKRNDKLVHQVVVGIQANMRAGTAHTKNRGEVRGGGKKPWRQKGTGRARHGSIRSPIWKGGGVTHGPRAEKDYSQKVNKKMRAKALYTALSSKLKSGHLFFVDTIAIPEAKTKEARKIFAELGKIPGAADMAKRKRNALYLAVAKRNDDTSRAFGNFGNVSLDETRNLNVLDILNNKYVIIANPEESISILEKRIK